VLDPVALGIEGSSQLLKGANSDTPKVLVEPLPPPSSGV
jgi:hypothetical protein